LLAIWYQGAPAPYTLRLLSVLFAAVAALRRRCYALGLLRSVQLPVPVVVVGNITVGGTGKTPVSAWLAGEFAQLGLRVGIVLRGYGGAGAAPALVTAVSDARQVGDEAVLLAQSSGALVAVGRERAAAATRLIDAGAQLIIADDGLQHLRLRRDVELAVIDGERGFGNRRLLPAGPLREPVAALARVAAVLQNGGIEPHWPGALRLQLAGHELQPVAGGATSRPLGALRGQRVHAVAGIGNPARFFALLRAAGLEPIEHPFPDHHRFAAAEIRFDDTLPVLMTGKDAVKCRAIADQRHWFLPVTVVMEPEARRQLLRRIIMDARLLDILVCPLCKGPLQHIRDRQELVCMADRLAFPVRDDIPVMLEEEARVLGADDPLLKR
jgi:tetraacyldisaccharide 4'-kinase